MSVFEPVCGLRRRAGKYALSGQRVLPCTTVDLAVVVCAMEGDVGTAEQILRLVTYACRMPEAFEREGRYLIEQGILAAFLPEHSMPEVSVRKRIGPRTPGMVRP